MRSPGVRKLRWALGLAAACALAAAPVAAGGSVEATADVELRTVRQSEILAAEALKLRVEADDPIAVELRGFSRLAREDKLVKVARPGTLELETGEREGVKLPLTGRGAERLARCEEQDLVIKLRASVAGDPLGDDDDGRARLVDAMAIDGPGCPPPAQPGQAPG